MKHVPAISFCLLMAALMLLAGTAGAATPAIIPAMPASGISTTSVPVTSPAGTDFGAVAAQMRSSLNGNLAFSLVPWDREKYKNGITPDAMGMLEKQVQASLSAFRYNEQSGAWTAVNYNQHMAFLTTETSGILITSDRGTAGMQFSGICRDECIPAAPAGTIQAEGTWLEINRGPATEWYLNTDTGIEQGMTLPESPGGTGNIRVAFDLSGTLTPALEGQTLVFSDRNGSVIRYAGLKAYDATGRTLPALMTLAGTRLVWQVDDRNAVYPVTVDPTWSQVKILTASDGADSAMFGYSVAISNDTAIVGAINAGGSNRGAAYIFRKDTGGTNNWGEVKIISASDAGNNAYFGNSVAISNDTAVVGAYGAPAGSYKGAAYIFQKDNGGTNNWGEVKIISASDAAGGAQFGQSVAISNDTAVVGANQAGVGGKAYIFRKGTGGINNWGEVKILTASDVSASASFGDSVGISNDTAVVGAGNAGGSNTGAAYIFRKETGGTNNWGEVKILTASDAAGGTQFGTSVAITNDTAIVGASQAGGDGEAYIFQKETGGTSNWGEVKKFTASGSDRFGNAVAISNDTAVVGAYRSPGGAYRGEAYIFRKDNGGTSNWGEVKKLTASDASFGTEFGYSVAISNDTAIVGSQKAAGGGSHRGEAYIFGDAPIVTGISPTSGTTAGGTSVTVTGTSLRGATAVKFGSTSAASYTVNSDTSITATSPAGSAGTVDITVTNDAGTSATGAADQFTYAADPPTVSSITPNSGLNTSTISITNLAGAGFSGTPVVNLTRSGQANITATGVTVVSSGKITCTFDLTGKTTGTWNVNVTNPDGQKASLAGGFTITNASSPPTVTAVSPTSGSTIGGTSVTVTGTGLTGATAVKFGSASAASYTVNSDSRVTATSPAGSAGTVDITVTTTAGTSATSASDQFTYTLTPTPIPSSGPDNADPGRGTATAATSPGAQAGQTMNFAVGQPVTSQEPGAIIAVAVVPSRSVGPTDLVVTDVGRIDTSALAGRETVQVVSIEVVGLNQNAVSSGTITFAVSGTWLSGHGVTPSDIVLMHNHDGTWTELQTRLDHVSGNTYYFVSDTPTFSYFAITTRKTANGGNVTAAVTGATAPVPTVLTFNEMVPSTTVPASLPSPARPATASTTAVPAPAAGPAGAGSVPAWLIGAGITLIAIIAAAGFLVRRWWIRRQNPALFRRFD